MEIEHNSISMASTMSMSGRRRWPVCFDGMGHGQAIFTAEYSHSPSMTPAALASVYDDDDKPVAEPPAADPARGDGTLVVSAHLEYPAIPNGEAHDGFVVMVHVKAPRLVAPGRPSLDLVAVLDAGASMACADKLEQVKRAMAFVVDRLGPRDRLSVVAFSTGDARRVTRLTRMSDDGKAAAKRAVESLVADADSGTGDSANNVRGGLDEAVKVLDGRRHDNDAAAAAVILLSDGQSFATSGGAGDYSALVPPYLKLNGFCRSTPVHAFAFGSGHGAAAMHHIAKATSGTFSFAESPAAIHDALAQCVGGLLSVAAKGVYIHVDWYPSCVRVRAVKSGRHYQTRFDNPRSRGDWEIWECRESGISADDLYADEERRFLIVMDIDRADGADIVANRLMKLRCTYLDTATGQEVNLPHLEELEVMRPLDAADMAPSVAVKREIVRVEAAEDMALARAAAERGDHAEAARILDARREAVGRSAPGMAGDAACVALAAELRELSLRLADEREEYRRAGSACLLAAGSAHAQQRGSSVWLPRPSPSGLEQFRCTGSAMFATPAMRRMERLSEKLRERQAAPAMVGKGSGGATFPPRSRLEARLAAAAPRISMLRKYRRLVPLFKR